MKCKYEHDGDCCNAGADQYMCKCKKPCEFIWPLSNADHIRAMSDEELARFLDDTQYREWEEIQENRQELVDFRSCVEGWTEWLKQPYKEAPNDST